jgi:hypothetical protein
MMKSPSIEEVRGKKFGVFTIKDTFSEGKNKYFVCVCDTCGSIVNRRWSDMYNRSNKFCNNCRTAPTIKKKGEAAFNRLLRVYKDAARQRNLSWDLTREQFKKLTSSNCHYCGEEPKHIVKGVYNNKGQYKLNGQYYHNGVDRRDSSKGYVLDNCVPCCKYCNLGKNDQSYEEYLERITKIYRNLII